MVLLLKIRQTGDPVLRETSRALEREEIRSSTIRDLIENMRETMREAPGVGLAAPQVGLPVQLAVIEDCPERLKTLSAAELAERGRIPVAFHVIINPQITLSDDPVAFHEGCLSIPGFSAVVRRSREVIVDCLNEHAEPVHIRAAGWYARILQHEIDHLHGRLYIDSMNARSFTTIENHNRYK